jgi:hypothetical protein
MCTHCNTVTRSHRERAHPTWPARLAPHSPGTHTPGSGALAHLRCSVTEAEVAPEPAVIQCAWLLAPAQNTRAAVGLVLSQKRIKLCERPANRLMNRCDKSIYVQPTRQLNFVPPTQYHHYTTFDIMLIDVVWLI